MKNVDCSITHKRAYLNLSILVGVTPNWVSMVFSSNIDVS